MDTATTTIIIVQVELTLSPSYDHLECILGLSFSSIEIQLNVSSLGKLLLCMLLLLQE